MGPKPVDSHTKNEDLLGTIESLVQQLYMAADELTDFADNIKRGDTDGRE